MYTDDDYMADLRFDLVYIVGICEAANQVRETINLTMSDSRQGDALREFEQMLEDNHPAILHLI